MKTWSYTSPCIPQCLYSLGGLQAQPQYIFMSTWNELIAQPQTMPGDSITGNIAMGFESDPTVGRVGFVGASSAVPHQEHDITNGRPQSPPTTC